MSLDSTISPQVGSDHACGACCTRLIDMSVALDGHPIIENINIHVHCGELTALIGPNGAGKTTLLRAILGELPYHGQLHFMRTSAGGNSPRIGYVPQRLNFDMTTPLSVLDLFAVSLTRRPLLIGRSSKLRDCALQSLKMTEAEHLIDKPLGKLSGGQLQRVLLSLALTPLPNLLLLDEPVAGLDQTGIDLFYHMVSDLRHRFDLSILLVTHDWAAAAHVADRIILLNRTIISDGTPDQVMQHRDFQRLMGFSNRPWECALPHAAVPRDEQERGHKKCPCCGEEGGRRS